VAINIIFFISPIFLVKLTKKYIFQLLGFFGILLLQNNIHKKYDILLAIGLAETVGLICQDP